MRVVRFLAVGVLNTGFGLVLIYLLMYLGLDYVVANALGYGGGFLLSFVLNRNWTFAHRGDWRASFLRWLVVAGVAYAGNLLTVILLHDGFGLDARLAQLGGVPVYTLLSYLGARRFAFASERAR